MKAPAAIREALTAAGGKLPYNDLQRKVGLDDMKLRPALYYLANKGDVKVGNDEGKTVTLTKSAGKKGKKQARGSKAKRDKAARKANRPYKEIAAKHTNGKAPGLRDLALENLLAAGALLRQAIEDGFDSLKDCHGINNAIANQQRAEQLLAAAKS